MITHESGLDAVSLAQELIRIETCQSGVATGPVLGGSSGRGRLIGCPGRRRPRGICCAVGHRSGTPGAMWPHRHRAGRPGGLDAPTFPARLNGQLHGRGSCDMKGALAAMAVALRDVADGSRRSKMSPWLSQRRRRWTPRAPGRCSRRVPSMACAMVIGEPTRMDLGISHKGALWVDAPTRAYRRHSSQPEQGRNAMLETLGWLTPFDELRGPDRGCRRRARPADGLAEHSPWRGCPERGPGGVFGPSWTSAPCRGCAMTS